MGVCCEKKALIGWRTVRNMRWRAPDRGRPKRTWREVVQKDSSIFEQGGCHEKAHKNWMMIWMVCGWVFLLVLAHPGSLGQRAVKQLLLLLNRIYYLGTSFSHPAFSVNPLSPLIHKYEHTHHTIYTQCSKKTATLFFGHNFGKWTPIFTILSLWDSAGNFL